MMLMALRNSWYTPGYDILAAAANCARSQRESERVEFRPGTTFIQARMVTDILDPLHATSEKPPAVSTCVRICHTTTMIFKA